MKSDTSGIDTHDLTRHLGVAYDRGIINLSFLPIGEEGYSYRAETASRSTYFLKAYAANRDHAAILERAFHLIFWLRVDHGQKVVLAPCTTKAGTPYTRYGDYLVALFEYIDGMTAMEEPLADTEWQRMAVLLAGVHESASALPPTLAVRKDLCDIPYRSTLLRLLEAREESRGLDTPIGRQVDRLLREHHDDITATLRMLEEAQAVGRRKERRLVLTHGDPNLANIIKDKHGQLYLIDWGDIALGPPERDLVFFTGPRFEIFLRAYMRSSSHLTVRAGLFRFYFYHWILQEISDYGTRILAGCARDDELWYYWQEFQQYVPIRHDEVARSTQAVRDVLQRSTTTDSTRWSRQVET